MQIGFFAIGIGPSADPELLALAALVVEQCAFHSLWTGEHVPSWSCQYASKVSLRSGRQDATPDYQGRFSRSICHADLRRRPYDRPSGGQPALPCTEHNPVVLAKQVASLDKLSGGRFDFGCRRRWLAEIRCRRRTLGAARRGARENISRR